MKVFPQIIGAEQLKKSSIAGGRDAAFRRARRADATPVTVSYKAQSG
jgi:hypothetical protein